MDGRRAKTDIHGQAAVEKWLLACASAAVYYALARVGLKLALEPSFASPMWPAAGFALAAAALWGPSAALGVFFGAWLADDRPFFSGQSPALAAALASTTLAGLGGAAQALFGAALLRRDGSAEEPSRRAREAAFFCVMAPLIALISPAFELLALAASGAPRDFDWARAGLTWWIGNAAGLLIVTPLLLAWARPRTKPALPAWARAATTAVAALAASVIWLTSRGGISVFGSSIQDSLMTASACLAALSASSLLARALLEEREAAMKAPSTDELAARERLEMNRRTFASLPIGIAILRFDEPGNAASLRVVAMNPAGRALSGAGAEPVEGMPLREFSPESFETELAPACLSVLKSGESLVIRDFLSRRRAPGAYFNLALFALGEREVGIAFEDVSEQIKSRKMLQDNAQLLLLMIESVREYAIFRVDEAGAVSSWSRGAELIFGYGAGEVLGTPYARLFPPDDPPRKQLDEAARAGRIKAESWCLRKDGSRFWADIVLTTLRDEAGKALGCVAVLRDVTQRRKSDVELANRTAALARSNAELAQFAYVASHDLSAPLHKVRAFADRLEDKLKGRLDDEGRDYMRRMLRAVDGMQSLIDGLLVLARVTTRGGAPEVVDLAALARDVVDGLDVAIANAKGRVELGALPRINADPMQMRQLLQNLISNAVKFHRPDAPPRVRVHGRATEDGLCELVVSDNGIGFDMKFAERVFQPFQRLNSPFQYEGSGIGLAICQKIAARHGGSISVKSEPGRGTEFKVVLPISQEGRMECQPLEKASG